MIQKFSSGFIIFLILVCLFFMLVGGTIGMGYGLFDENNTGLINSLGWFFSATSFVVGLMLFLEIMARWSKK